MLSVVRREGNMPDVKGPENRPVILIIFLSLSKKWLTQSADQAGIVLSVKKMASESQNALKQRINKVRGENYSAIDVRLLGQIK